jgi:hypothetical protein
LVLSKLRIPVSLICLESGSFQFSESEEIGCLIQIRPKVDLFDLVLSEICDTSEFISNTCSAHANQLIYERWLKFVVIHENI